MYRYFLHLAYQGQAYRGWQRQKNVTSVQETLEDALEKVLRRKTVSIGCGRTDAEVHAAQYFCHIDTTEPLREDFLTVINRCLPADIAIYEVIPATNAQHAQHSANWRTYHYYFHLDKNPFLEAYSFHYQKESLDIDVLQELLAELSKHTDFRTFCKTPDSHNHTICYLTKAILVMDESKRYFRIEITASRFLRGMMRLLIGNMLKTAAGRKTYAQFIEELEQKEPPQFAEYAPPQGLYLAKIIYPFLERPIQAVFPPS